MDALVEQIFSKLSAHFSSNSFPDGPLYMLQLTAQVRTTAVAVKSYRLFETIMRSTAEQERKMKAAQLALSAAYPPGLEPAPPAARDPQLILSFLRSHVDPSVGRKDRAISSAMRAIDSASENPASRSWTWRIEDAGELLTWFGQSSRSEEFNWWYGVLWLHYGEVDPEVWGRMDEIGMSGDDRVDLKQCKVAVENEVERVRRLDGATSIVRSLEEAYDRLTDLIDHRERVSNRSFQAVWTGLISLSTIQSRLPVVPFTLPGSLPIVRDYRQQ